jgi:predicted deacylase
MKSRRQFLRLAGAGLLAAGGIMPEYKSINQSPFFNAPEIISPGLAGLNFFPVNGYSQGRGRKNKVTVDRAVATLENGSVFANHFWRIESGKEGPSLLLIAAQHGNEVQGTEVGRRFQQICASDLTAGTVWIIPMAELRGIRIRRYTVESLPEQRVQDKAFHRSWPGNPRGNDNERIAFALDQAVVKHCSHAMDMHCWAQITAAETLSEESTKISHSMGQVTTSRFISLRNTPVSPEKDKLIFSQLMLKRGNGFTVMELSGQYQMQERQVQIGLSSMVNIAKLLGMIEGEPEAIKGQRVVHSDANSHDVPAPASGIFMPALRKDEAAMLLPEDFVEKGQSLGHIIRDSDLETIPVIAPVSGYLWRYGVCHWGLCDASLPAQHPYTDEGESVAVIVSA